MNYKKQLTESILPFWLKNALDLKNGGIYTSLEEDGTIYGRDKSVWFQGRALWSFSKAYNAIEQRPEYLDAAKCIYDFLPKCTDDDGRMYFTVTEDGRGIQKRRYYFSETFAAIGAAEYYLATGLADALDTARKYFCVAYECFTGVRKNEPKFKEDVCNCKALSPVMIMLSTAQTMRAADKDKAEYYDKIAKACLDEILHGGFLTDGALLETVSKDGLSIDSPAGRTVNPGHSMEAAWFVMLEGLLTGNEEAVLSGKRIIDITLPLGWDKKRGGIKAFVDKNGRPAAQLEWDMKLWWPQCEAMIALRMAYLQFGEEKYLKLYEEIKEYCKKYFIDSDDGEWYGYLHYDNSVSTTLKGNIFKGPFHIPRLYILMAVLDECADIKKYAE